MTVQILRWKGYREAYAGQGRGGRQEVLCWGTLCHQILGRMGFLEGKEIFIAVSNQSCEKWILGRLSKNILGFKKKKSTHRKTGKVLSQFPTQLLLNTHLYNENTQAGGLYSLRLGSNRTGLQGQSVALALLVSALFILRHHRRVDR